jgi:hypothetical protein
MKLNRLFIVLVIVAAISGCSKKTNETNEQVVSTSAKLTGTWVQKSSTIFYYDDYGNLLGAVSGLMVNLKLDSGLVQAYDVGYHQTLTGQYTVMTASRGNVLDITIGGVTHYYDITLLHPPDLTLSETIGGLNNTSTVVLGGREIIYTKSVQENTYTSSDARN